MNDHTLIPFGLRLSDKKLVDVSEVQNGLKCKCICPSCNAPLLARQGKINEWHFAHVSKGASESVKKDCEYSFWVSVTLMAKQVIASATTIKLPSLTMFLSDGKEVAIAKNKIVEIDDIQLEKYIDNFYADALIRIGSYVVVVIFTTPKKLFIKNTLQGYQSRNTGVLEISLSNAYEWFFGTEINGEYSRKISYHIINDIDNKIWLHHPRTMLYEEKNKAKLYISKPIDRNVISSRSFHLEEKYYSCLMCNHEWHGTHICPKCKTHLGSVEAKTM